MPRPRRVTTADTLPPADAPSPTQASPPAAVPPDPAPAQPERTPERQRLAEAIERVRALEAEIREASAAVEPARQATWDAQRALDAAEETLKAARPRDSYAPPPSPAYSYWGSQAEADDAAARARAAAEAPPVSIADAKVAVEVARDALDSARRTRQWHEDKQRTAEQRLMMYRSNISGAVRAVLRADPAVLALAMECRRLKTRAEAARQAFGEILWGDVVQFGSPFYGWDQVADARDGPEAMADWSVSREWSAAIEALASDPDAPLPAVP